MMAVNCIFLGTHSPDTTGLPYSEQSLKYGTITMRPDVDLGKYKYYVIRCLV